MHRSPARYLAPLALIAFVAAVAVVVNGAGVGSKAKVRTQPATVVHRHLRRTYIVRTGDSLSRISVRTGVSVVQLLQLNPKLDPNAIRPGQRLKLRT
jgi:LysM repeat protein